jgi:hypothetical protein
MFVSFGSYDFRRLFLACAGACVRTCVSLGLNFNAAAAAQLNVGYATSVSQIHGSGLKAVANQ